MKAIFKFLWKLICFVVIVGIHAGAVYIYYDHERMLSNRHGYDLHYKSIIFVGIIMLISCIFFLILSLISFEKTCRSVFGILKELILAALGILFYVGIVVLINKFWGLNTIVIIIAIGLSLWSLWGSFKEIVSYIRYGHSIYYNSGIPHNPYGYGTPEYDTWEIRHQLEELNKKL